MSDIERMAAIAAQHVNGGEFANGQFYSPEHRAKWIEAMTLATERLRADGRESERLAGKYAAESAILEARLAEAVESLRAINRLASPDPARTFDDAIRDLEHVTAFARAFLAKMEGRSGE